MRTLIVEDEIDYSQLLKQRLQRQKMEIDLAHTLKEALQMLAKESYDVILLDLLLPDGNGLDFLVRIKEIDPFVEIVILTGHGNLENAIQSIKQGAYDFLTKPCNMTKLEFTLIKAYEKKCLAEQAAGLSEALNRQAANEPLIGQSAAMKNVVEMIHKVKDSDATILLLGESGSGKEIVARSLHFWSYRKNKPFQALNCAALPPQIVESELFGHEKGAFTGASASKLGLIEIAEGGTLFLDEIAEMDMGTQAKILRIIESGEYFRVGATRPRKIKLRIVAATNKNLEDEVISGKFREDLYYRLNVFQIIIPPLRKRKEDLPLLADYLLRKKCSKNNLKTLSPEALSSLQKYDFPGNVRELANMLERGIIMSQSSVIEAEHLFCQPMENTLLMNRNLNKAESKDNEIKTDDLSLEACEKQHIKTVLNLAEGNKTKAANLLKIGLKTLYRKINKYGLS